MLSKYIKYPLAKETINNEDINALIDWLKTSPRLTKGDLTLEFEKDWAAYIGTKYAVFCNSGSSANLLMAYSALQAGKLKNKKVAVPAVGWVTTIAPFMQFGFEPHMVDADPDTYGINLNHLESLCQKEDIGAVIFVQVLGVPHYKEALLDLQKKYGFYLFEDSCAALGAEYQDGTMVGKVGDAASFSFYFGHQLSTIEGGMVNTNDDDLYHMMMMARSHGWGKDLPKSKYDELMKEGGVDPFHQPFTFFIPGLNLRSTDLQAFLGVRQVKKANWAADRRHQNHLAYAKNLSGKFDFQKWGDHKPVSISFGCLARSAEHRRAIVETLVEAGVETRLFSAGNLGAHPFWVNEYGRFDGEVADEIHQRGFFLPNYPELTEEEINNICELVCSVEVAV